MTLVLVNMAITKVMMAGQAKDRPMRPDNDNIPPIPCRHCGADWRIGAFTEGCVECGGGALTRYCPLCGGACAQTWRRSVIDSNDSGTAHWSGTCFLADAGDSADTVRSAGRVEWWLDESALPDLLWALLVDAPTGGVLVRDLDGTDHRFDDYDTAIGWLRQDEYERLDHLRAEENFVPARPPPVAWLGKRFIEIH